MVLFIYDLEINLNDRSKTVDVIYFDFQKLLIAYKLFKVTSFLIISFLIN